LPAGPAVPSPPSHDRQPPPRRRSTAGTSDCRAQPLVDTLFTWKDYGRTALCRVRIYPGPPGDERTQTVVLQEQAENRGASTTADARHLVELVGRQFGLDPAASYWIFHWGTFSFEGAQAEPRKELFLRATFRRTRGESLSTPTWRVITREEVENLTDRRFE
jgi:hypothetical protein